MPSHSEPSVVIAAQGLLDIFEKWRSFDYLESRLSRYQDSLNYHYNLDFEPPVKNTSRHAPRPWKDNAKGGGPTFQGCHAYQKLEATETSTSPLP